MPSSAGDSAPATYSAADRLLHRIALTHAVMELSFDIERSRYGKAAAALPDGGAPVFVTGLARAGTTILMRRLHDTGRFASLTYRDMPFPLAPNSWAKLAGKRKAVASVERGHGDGLSHDLDSPEAIEEVFWRAFEGKHYIKRTHVLPHEPGDETIAGFRDLTALVRLRHDRPRYLSKNNANVLRLGAIVAAFPDAMLVHPFRDPLQQAASLLNQHRRAIAGGDADPFRARFMTWLGHHEFGRDHRPALIPGAPEDFEAADRIDYWLKVWIATHRLLLAQPDAVRARQAFVDFDALCAQPATIAALSKATGADLGMGEGLHPPRAHDVTGTDHALLDQARAVHADLKTR